MPSGSRLAREFGQAIVNLSRDVERKERVNVRRKRAIVEQTRERHDYSAALLEIANGSEPNAAAIAQAALIPYFTTPLDEAWERHRARLASKASSPETEEKK